VEDWHRGDWMQTYTGKAFYPLDPRAEDIDPVDIGHGLSRQCRYNGHVRDYYSVAEHCVHLSYVVPKEYALWALLHDATEAYVGDVIRPMKRYLPQFTDIEDVVMVAIVNRFGLDTLNATMRIVQLGEEELPRLAISMPEVVKEADTRLLLNERRDMLGEPPQEWGVNGEPFPNVFIDGWSPETAKTLYMLRLSELTGEEYAW